MACILLVFGTTDGQIARIASAPAQVTRDLWPEVVAAPRREGERRITTLQAR